jgi:hypothetical protein
MYELSQNLFVFSSDLQWGFLTLNPHLPFLPSCVSVYVKMIKIKNKKCEFEVAIKSMMKFFREGGLFWG